MERKDKIYSYISSSNYIPLTFEELSVVLDVPAEDSSEFKSIIDELIREGKIFCSKRKRYAPCEKNNIFPGILSINPRGGFGFVRIENAEKDIFIPSDSMNTATDGDKVLVKLIKNRHRRDEGEIISVLERSQRPVSAVLTDDFSAKPDNPRLPFSVKLKELCGAKTGDRVLLNLTDFLPNGVVYGEVSAVLGSSRDLKTFADTIIIENGIKTTFESETLSEAAAYSDRLSPEDYKGREDYRKDTVFTIDGDDARDFDDAVSLKILENGNFSLGVHIADVTHYVAEGSALDNEAFIRGTSVYLTDRVIPMLPVKLSNGLCSLNPNEDRLTLSVIMEIDKESGNVIRHKLVKSVIRSCERMTYNNTAKILCGDEVMCNRYRHLVPVLTKMHKLSKLLFKRRMDRGSINFDFPEPKINLDENGIPVSIEKTVRNDAHRLIEEFMLIANETVAEFAFWADIPFVYRVHEQPDAEKMDSFRKFIGSFGYVMKGKEVYPKDLQQILNEIKGTENETMIAAYMLRSLMKAEYRPECIGHFGLAAKYYSHFTSPIRRYPDLTIHRILKAFLDGKDLSHYPDFVKDSASHSSDTERTAELCERSVSDLYKTAYIRDFVGCTFPAVISGITNFGIFAELENSVEGLIRLETIAGDYYELDEKARCVTGRRHGFVFRIGDSVNIEVVRADLETRQIDFVLADNKFKKSPKAGAFRHRNERNKHAYSKNKVRHRR
ncbi:MAG: ribonuclease R [Clostridiales bacterium]|nr:ribonuclease R [Clostridiales bacterium]